MRRFCLRSADALKEIYRDRYLWCDWAWFYIQSSGVRRVSRKSPKDGRRVLILSLSGMIYASKMEAILGSSLLRKGAKASVLLENRRNKWSVRYFRAVGIHDFIYVEDIEINEGEKLYCDQIAKSLVADGFKFEKIKQWKALDAWIGPQILSTISRKRFEGMPDTESDEISTQIKAHLPDLIHRNLVARKIVEDLGCALGVTIETNYEQYGPFCDALVAIDVPLISVIQPWREDALYLKRINRETRRLHSSSISKQTFQKITSDKWSAEKDQLVDEYFQKRYSGEWEFQSRNQAKTTKYDKNDILKQINASVDKKNVVVFCPVLWDANLFYGEDLFKDFGEWFVETVKAANKNESVNWIIKLHPANDWKMARGGFSGSYSELKLIDEYVGKLKGHVHLLMPNTDISTMSLFQIADFGVTVRGTSGMELPCFGASCITAGTGRYSDLGFTIDPKSSDEYLAILRHIHELPLATTEQTELARRHAYAIFHLRPLELKSIEVTVKSEKGARDRRLIENVNWRRSALNFSSNYSDLDAFSEWALNSNDVDYLRED